MQRELPPALTEALGRRHREDVERIKAYFAEKPSKAAQHDLVHFERTNDQLLPAYARTAIVFALSVVATFLLSRL